jgi:nickel-dependent lactate racemase
MIYYAQGSAGNSLTDVNIQQALHNAYKKLGPRKRILIIPPDFTRLHSRAGDLTVASWEYFGNAVKAIMPALGTHVPMTREEREIMFPGIPHSLFRNHNWRTDIIHMGMIEGDYVAHVCGGVVSYDIDVEINRLLLEGEFDLILSIGQVVPHEVVGMANYTKNIVIGVGGSNFIHRSHFLGAAYGMERIMGRSDTPVRKVIDKAAQTFLADLPIVYCLNVMEKDANGNMHMRGLYIGDDAACFEQAAELSREVNFNVLPDAIERCVVYLDPNEYRTTWLGNKAIYRTRMAMADDGELLILAPGVKRFGEDKQIDDLIRTFGYKGTPHTLQAVNTNPELHNNLSAAAHLIHGSSEDRFRITYATKSLSSKEIEAVGYKHTALDKALSHYAPEVLKDGWNEDTEGEFFFISNPALGLWASKGHLQ